MTATKTKQTTYTLIEIVIAILIFTILITLLFNFSNHISKMWKKLQQEKKIFNELMTLDRSLDNILSNTIPFIWRDDENRKMLLFSGDPQQLILTYIHHTNNIKQGGIRFMAIRQEEDQLVAYYQERPTLTWDNINSDLVTRTILAKNIESITFNYADYIPIDEKFTWQENWEGLQAADNLNDVRLEIPLAIMIHITWKNGRDESWIRRTTGSSWHERYGSWQGEKEQ